MVPAISQTGMVEGLNQQNSRLSTLHSPGKLEFFLLLGIVTCARAEATLHGKKLFHAAYSAFDTVFYSLLCTLVKT